MLSGLIKLNCEDFIMLTDMNSTVGNVAFGFVHNATSQEFPKGNCTNGRNGLINTWAPHFASSLLKLKSEFHKSKLNSIGKGPDEWISNLDGL